MAAWQLDVAEECFTHATDLSGLLLLYSSLGDVEGLIKLAQLAKNQGKNNVSFLCLFLLGKLEECVDLLIHRPVQTFLFLYLQVDFSQPIRDMYVDCGTCSCLQQSCSRGCILCSNVSTK